MRVGNKVDENTIFTCRLFTQHNINVHCTTKSITPIIPLQFEADLFPKYFRYVSAIDRNMIKKRN